jgi:predicted ATPase
VQSLPVLLIITCRPEFAPPWTGRSHVTVHPLNRLGRREGLAMIERLSGGIALPREVMDQIIARTDGVPLFIEELTKAILESGLLRTENGRYILTAPLLSLNIPRTLHASLMARLDRLAPAREVAQIAAVIGREFTYELLAAVAPLPDHQLCNALDQLVEAGLVFRRGVPPEAIYTFKHALVQEVAYSTLLRSRRQELHARIARIIDEKLPSLAEQRPELLAHHLDEAGLTDRASDAWASAGLAALGRGAMKEAAIELERAIELLRAMHPSPALRRRELELLGKLAVALVNTKGPGSPEVELAQQRAAILAADLADKEGTFRARWMLWRTMNVRAELDRAIALGMNLLEEAADNPDLVYQAHHALWSSHLFRGNLRETCAHVDLALALYDPARHDSDAMIYGGHDARECGLTHSGNALFLLGYPEQALARNRAGLEHARRLGHPQIVAHALNWGVLLLQLAGEHAELHCRIDDLARLADQHGLAIYASEARIREAWLRVARESDRLAADVMQDQLDRRVAMGTSFVQTHFLLLMADARLRLGQNEEAMAAAQEGLARAERTGERLSIPELHRFVAAIHLARDARAHEPAETALRAAIVEARARGAKLFELRAARDLASLWADRGERRRARDLLAPVYAWFSEGFSTGDLMEARALLDDLARES